jgi:hypothetical protein
MNSQAFIGHEPQCEERAYEITMNTLSGSPGIQRRGLHRRRVRWGHEYYVFHPLVTSLAEGSLRFDTILVLADHPPCVRRWPIASSAVCQLRLHCPAAYQASRCYVPSHRFHRAYEMMRGGIIVREISVEVALRYVAHVAVLRKVHLMRQPIRGRYVPLHNFTFSFSDVTSPSWSTNL